MSKYIDAEKLIAEIERRIESWDIRGKNSPAGQGKDTCESRVTELSDLLSFITSLQQEQPEVDLEKFISDFIDKKDSENQGRWYEEDIIEAMKSSFALGLNARKDG